MWDLIIKNMLGVISIVQFLFCVGNGKVHRESY
jgi:hypothetical protein